MHVCMSVQAYELITAAGGVLAEHALVISGRMAGESKALALEAFRAGKCRLLLSTVVIEVGIDVPDATLMVVEHAERFGLLQLHQLRGRVGRSHKQSACVLVTPAKSSLERLQVLAVRLPRACAPTPV
jgi:ATP-dependent DNA helicase RecG